MILRKVACGIKTLPSIKKLLPIKARLLFINILVISHLYSWLTLLIEFEKFINLIVGQLRLDVIGPNSMHLPI